MTDASPDSRRKVDHGCNAFFKANRKLLLPVSLNLLLLSALLILLHLVYPQLIYRLDSVTNLWDRYSIRTYTKGDGPTAYFEIVAGYRRLYSYSGKQRFSVEVAGGDVTGNNLRDLVVRQWLGGAHGDSTYLVLELDGSAVKQIDVIDGLLDVQVRDLNDDGIEEMTGVDNVYSGFVGESNAGSPRPLVVLSFDKARGRFVPDTKLMQRPAFSREQLNELALRYKDDPSWQERSRPPSDLFNTMLNLIYTGNEEQAWQLFDVSWLEGYAGQKDEYRNGIRAELNRSLVRSPFYPVIAAWNNAGRDKPVSAGSPVRGRQSRPQTAL